MKIPNRPAAVSYAKRFFRYRATATLLKSVWEGIETKVTKSEDLPSDSRQNRLSRSEASWQNALRGALRNFFSEKEDCFSAKNDVKRFYVEKLRTYRPAFCRCWLETNSLRTQRYSHFSRPFADILTKRLSVLHLSIAQR